jgi:hypothetical protein
LAASCNQYVLDNDDVWRHFAWFADGLVEITVGLKNRVLDNP